MSENSQERFQDALANFVEYPAKNTAIRTSIFGHSLDLLLKRLKEKHVFHEKYRSLGFVDLVEGSQAFYPVRGIDTVKKLEGHLNDDDGAPLWRMVFLQSNSSRGSLGCTREQLSMLLTYYQVMPSFLDLVLTFEHRLRPLNRTMFRHEDYLAADAEPLALPHLGRSGKLIQHAFNLLSIEPDERPGITGQWYPRQVALYHSFDVANGRSLWIVLKGNSLIAKRFLASAGSHRHLKARAITSPETSFVAALHVHLMMLDWCIEDWADYIDHLESLLEDISSDAKMAPVDQATEARGLALTYGSRRTSTMRSQAGPSRQGTLQKFESISPQDPSSSAPSSPNSPVDRTLTRSFSDLIPAMRRLSTFRSHKTKKSWAGDVESGPITEQPSGDDGDEDDDSIDARAELEELGKNFSFKQFQRLNNITDDVEQRRVAIEQNKGVLLELRQHYEEVVASHGFKTCIEEEQCRGEITAFFRKVKSIERELEVHYSRLNSLARALDNEKVMFTSILQYKSEKTSEFFAASAKQSSDRMELWTLEMHKIAVKTEQETVSMHVITVFTLIFLPGTFLATFFSSGILDWDASGLPWAVRTGAMRLFVYISVPMMFLIIAGWFLFYLVAKRKSQKKMSRVLNEVEGQLAGDSEAELTVKETGLVARAHVALSNGKVLASNLGRRCAQPGIVDEKS